MGGGANPQTLVDFKQLYNQNFLKYFDKYGTADKLTQ
jgi:hypothetical protein